MNGMMTLTLCSTNKFMKICDTQIIDFCRSQSVYHEENIIDGFQHGFGAFCMVPNCLVVGCQEDF